MSTSHEDVITWNDIHHKTSLNEKYLNPQMNKTSIV